MEKGEVLRHQLEEEGIEKEKMGQKVKGYRGTVKGTLNGERRRRKRGKKMEEKRRGKKREQGKKKRKV